MIPASTSMMMASKSFPIVHSSTTGNSLGGSTTQTVNLPAGIVAGDLIVIAFTAYNDTVPVTITPPAGFTGLTGTTSASRSNHRTCYKFATGGETSVNFTLSTSAFFGAWCVYVIKGAASITAATPASQASGSNPPNSPSHTASWGADKNLWISTCGYNTAGASAQSAPSGYNNLIQLNVTTGGNDAPRTCMASAQKELGTEDPGAYSVSLSGTHGWIATTLVVKPV